MIGVLIGVVLGVGVAGILGLVWALWLASRHPELRRVWEQEERERIKRWRAAMSECVRFDCPLPPRGLRTNRATRVNTYRARLVREYQEEVWCAGRMAWDEAARQDPLGTGLALDHCPWAKARVRLTWYHAGVAPDADNALHSLKALIDVLHTRSKRPLGIVLDDNADCLTIERVETVKVAHRADERASVEVERL